MSLPNIVIVSIARTPIGRFRGSLSSLKASELASIAISGALGKVQQHDRHHRGSDLKIGEAYLGNVVSAGMGQAPARQASMGAGLPVDVCCTTVNKVCASGMKSVMLAAQSLTLGGNAAGANANRSDSSTSRSSSLPSLPGYAVIAGGMESMSNVPHYLLGSRNGYPLGNTTLTDGVIHDGLWDPYHDQHMGVCGEKCARDYSITRAEQDEYAIESYRRAQNAIARGLFQSEIVPVHVPSATKRGGDPIKVDTDEEPGAVNLDKLPMLKPAFDRQRGTITAANASSLNDGAAALVLMTEDDAVARGIKPLARILGYGDAEQEPVDFATSPSLAIPVAAKRAGLALSDIEYHEINEAFSVVAIANMKLLNLDHARVNVLGGAVALGHPIGMSGTRIVGTLYNALQNNDATIGCASICNGGGGASAIILERLN